jgi:sirohydrochlorin ferrochelatase
MNALILFSHGSTLCGAGDALAEHAERLRTSFDLVEVGYMNYSTPTFEDALTKIVAAGATVVCVVPFFLVPGYFVTKSLPERVESAKTAYTNVTFKIAEPLGFDDLLADALIASGKTPLNDHEWREGLATAYRSCRRSPDCPVFGTSTCPVTYELEASLAR